jgi:hypothetical protein
MKPGRTGQVQPCLVLSVAGRTVGMVTPEVMALPSRRLLREEGTAGFGPRCELPLQCRVGLEWDDFRPEAFEFPAVLRHDHADKPVGAGG